MQRGKPRLCVSAWSQSLGTSWVLMLSGILHGQVSILLGVFNQVDWKDGAGLGVKEFELSAWERPAKS